MRIENTSEAQRHLHGAGQEPVIVPAKRDGINGSVEVSDAFLKAAKDDIDGYVKDGVLVLASGPKAAPAPVKTDEQKAAENIKAITDRQEADKAAAEGKQKK